MIFELWNDIVPILFSISIYVAFLTAHIINGIVTEHTVKHRSWMNDSSAAIKLKYAAGQLITVNSEEQQSFITRITKRKEAPEDDSDYDYSSIFTMSFIKRGGEITTWKTTLYSQPLKNMVFSF